MAELALVRLDDRLIHGQVLVSLLKVVGSKKIIIVDDKIVNDKFQTTILKAVCPKDQAFEIMDTDQVAKSFQEEQLGSVGPILAIYKDVDNLYRSYQKGFKFDKLQIGGARTTTHGDGRKQIGNNQVFFNKEEADMLEEMANDGVEISIRQTPQAQPIEWKSAYARYFK